MEPKTEIPHAAGLGMHSSMELPGSSTYNAARRPHFAEQAGLNGSFSQARLWERGQTEYIAFAQPDDSRTHYTQVGGTVYVHQLEKRIANLSQPIESIVISVAGICRTQNIQTSGFGSGAYPELNTCQAWKRITAWKYRKV